MGLGCCRWVPRCCHSRGTPPTLWDIVIVYIAHDVSGCRWSWLCIVCCYWSGQVVVSRSFLCAPLFQRMGLAMMHKTWGVLSIGMEAPTCMWPVIVLLRFWMVHDTVGLVLLFHMAGLDSSLLARPSDQPSIWLPWASPFVWCYSGPEWQVVTVTLIVPLSSLLRGSGSLLLVLEWWVVLFWLGVRLGRSPLSHFLCYCGLGWQSVML